MAENTPAPQSADQDTNNSGSSGGKGPDAYPIDGPVLMGDDNNSGSSGGKGPDAYPAEGPARMRK